MRFFAAIKLPPLLDVVNHGFFSWQGGISIEEGKEIDREK